MPRAAITLGGAELIMAPEDIGHQISVLLEVPRARTAAIKRATRISEGPVDDIINGIWRRQQLDFSKYKDATIARQINRRLTALQLDDLDAYAAFTREHPEELDALAKSFLISVTAFFRDKEAFEAVGEVIRTIVAAKKPGEPIRIWVPGVGTGEEAYSIAILVHEAMEGNLTRHPTQIFATDIDVDAIAHARKGRYPEASLEALDKARIQRYFSATATGYRIEPRIQEMVAFARQDLIRDPPFLRLDLISCRNVFIYFKPDLQQHLFQVFHYALNPGGRVFMGSSEVIGTSTLFKQTHKARIFQRNDLAQLLTPRLIQLHSPVSGLGRIPPSTKPLDPKLLLREQLARAYAPPSVLMDGGNKLVELFGQTQPYFQLGEGSAQLDVLRFIRSDLRTELRALIHRVRQGGADSAAGQAHYAEGEDSGFRMCVARIASGQGESTALRLSFEVARRTVEATRFSKRGAKRSEPDAAEQDQIRVLQDELTNTREHLQTVIEELETSNEEFQSLNEELQAAGEELQASNEELATSNEELQATNEELTTVNDELQAKTQEVVSTLEELENVQDATSVAMVVLDKDLLITRFNANAVRQIGLTQSDLGRNLAALPIRIPQADIQTQLHHVMAGATIDPFELDVGDSVFQIEIRPYLGKHHAIEGAVLSMADITELKNREQALLEANRLFETFAATNQAVIWVQEPEFGPIRYVNPAFRHLYGLDPQMVLRDPEYLFKVMHEADAHALKQAHLNTRDEPWSLESRIIHPKDGATHWLRTRAFPLREHGRLRYVVGFTFDITAEYEHGSGSGSGSVSGDIDLCRLFDLLMETGADGIIGFDTEARILFVNGAVESLLALEGKGLVGQPASAVLAAEEAEQLAKLIAMSTRQRRTLKRVATATDGAAHRSLEIVLSTEPLMLGGRAAAVAVFRNPFGHRQVLRQLQIADSVFRTTQDGVMVLDDDTRIILVNPALLRILKRSEDLLIGSVPDIFPARATRSAFNADIWRTLEQSRRWSGEVHAQVEGDNFVVLETEVSTLERTSVDDLGHYMVVVTDITQRRSYEQTIYHQANFDALTNLPNRLLLEDRLGQELRHARREGYGLTLMFIDLDRFKEVNDSLGHEAGDELLVGVAERIHGLVRASDTLSRFGGDEFVLLLPKYQRSQAPEITAREVLQALEKPFEIKGQTLFASASIGIAVFPQDGSESSDLLRNADAAMYQAKHGGRHGFAFFQAGMNADAMRRLKLETDLRNAIANGELCAFYQPVVVAASGRPCSLEALVRWRHPKYGLLPPAAFIPHAEESGLIEPITRLVLADARARLAAWRQRIDASLQVAVNFSPRLFRRLDLAELFGAGPNDTLNGLVVEVTESLFMGAGDTRVMANLTWLTERGARIALDDFGTGYSSLAYVRDFPVNVIKIDRSFVKDLGATDHLRDLALIEAAITMAHGVGARVIAEGVETHLQAETLVRLGADQLQGFLFAKPMPPEKVEAYLMAHNASIQEQAT
ncbi:EAL domain-containing protein [Thiocystis violacea]|uniref:EAL domain-containing protein n=1 Tax=Thiocystis violacea TaxID=13725 RepID=UPI0031F7DE6F